MTDCEHLIVHPPQQMPHDQLAAPLVQCGLKGDFEIRIKMAMEAADILKTTCPPNDDCHYYPHDRCQDCPDHA